MIHFLIFFCVFQTVVCGDENILCTSDFCKDVTCSELSTKCQTQNSTHNGVFFTSPTTCNCCEFCLDNLAEGESCSTGDISDPVPKEMCGPSLYCKPNNPDDTDGVCSRMSTACTKLQDDYELKKLNGTLGTMEVKQDCDSDGDFVPYKCIPGQTCYCVDSVGNRIFGESDFTSLPASDLLCKCSRDYLEATAIIDRELNPSEHFRCTANGDYDTLQCIGDKCLCVDASDGAPTYPNDHLVPMVNISKSTLNCYKNKEERVYFKPCEQEYIDVLKEYNSAKKDGYSILLGFEYPKCDIDGTYQAVQENKTHKYCVDKEGTILTVVDKANATLANSMDCKCLRASLVMKASDKPSCQANGNYQPKQCRRGRCRCVDNNGNQVCKKVNCEVDEMQNLTC